MDGEKFDDLIRRICTTRLTRMSALRGLVGSAAAALAGAAVASNEAEAKPKKVSGAKKGKGKQGKGKQGKGNSQRASSQATVSGVCGSEGGADKFWWCHSTASGGIITTACFPCNGE